MEGGARDTTQSDRSRIVGLYHNCDLTTTRLRYVVYDDTTTHSTTTEVIEITICVRFDCDTTTIRLRRIARLLPFDTIRRQQKMNINFSSLSCRSRIAVESQL